MAQLSAYADERISAILDTIRHSTTIPSLEYHFGKHRAALGAASSAEYERLLREHLTRPDLRVFTFLRPLAQVAMWALVAEEGKTVIYNELRDRIWSFYTSPDVGRRMAAVQPHWVELTLECGHWRVSDRWKW